MRKKRATKVKYCTISLPSGLCGEIDQVREVGFWPSRAAFVREACLEKIAKERKPPTD